MPHILGEGWKSFPDMQQTMIQGTEYFLTKLNPQTPVSPEYVTLQDLFNTAEDVVAVLE